MMLDRKTAAVTGRIKAAIERRFGNELAGVYLFGSRARGNHRPDSDLDIAVVLRRIERPLQRVDEDLLDLTYPIEIDTGLHIQAWALSEPETEAVGTRARLAATVRREGVLV